jgi:23S rRNA pseudouridine955/2504/2580 synthase
VSTKQNSLPLRPDLNINIVYEDQNILLVLKEHNQEIYKKSDPNCLDNQVQYYLYQQNPEKYQQQLQNFFVPVALHRLDKLTKGLVIYAKNASSKKILYNSINDKSKITKTYLVICENQQKKIIPSFIQG